MDEEQHKFLRWLIVAAAAVIIVCTGSCLAAYIVNPKVWYCTVGFGDQTPCKNSSLEGK